MVLNKIGIHLNIAKKLYFKFKSCCALNGVSMSAVVNELIEKYVKAYEN